jgi:hypothetical protein
MPRLEGSDDTQRRKDDAWAKLCRENGWVCKLCGSFPEVGKRFEDELCEDCRLQIRNE